MSSSATEKHLRTQLDELQRRYDTLTNRIAALDTDVGRELDSERKLVLEERRADLAAERDQVAAELAQIERQVCGLGTIQNSSAGKKPVAAPPPAKPVLLPQSEASGLPTRSIVSLLLSEMTSSEADCSSAFAYLVQLEPNSDGPYHTAICDGLLKILQDCKHTAQERVKAGNALGQLGDPRFRPEAWFLPYDALLGFVKIPAGEFIMGEGALEGPSTGLRERQAHICTLPTYLLARYPVTVAQFRAFMEDARYARHSGLQVGGESSHPVAGVTWYEALAYCEWLTARLLASPDLSGHIHSLLKAEATGGAWRITLPSEAEWEKAARGLRDPRPYPWGFDEPSSDRANFFGSGFKRTSTVGCFPRGKSPFKIEDMSGNVWEWTRTIWGPDLTRPHFRYPYETSDGREQISASGRFRRVLRGGSYEDAAARIRCTDYCAEVPEAQFGHFGFRLAITLQTLQK